MIILCLSAFDEPLATTTATRQFSAGTLSWFLPLIASHGLLPLPLERLSFLCLPINTTQPFMPC